MTCGVGVLVCDMSRIGEFIQMQIASFQGLGEVGERGAAAGEGVLPLSHGNVPELDRGDGGIML